MQMYFNMDIDKIFCINQTKLDPYIRQDIEVDGITYVSIKHYLDILFLPNLDDRLKMLLHPINYICGNTKHIRIDRKDYEYEYTRMLPLLIEKVMVENDHILKEVINLPINRYIAFFNLTCDRLDGICCCDLCQGQGENLIGKAWNRCFEIVHMRNRYLEISRPSEEDRLR